MWRAGARPAEGRGACEHAPYGRGESGRAEASLDTPSSLEDAREARAEAEIKERAGRERSTMEERARLKLEAWQVKAAEFF
jgi:hypothetical protein